MQIHSEHIPYQYMAPQDRQSTKRETSGAGSGVQCSAVADHNPSSVYHVASLPQHPRHATLLQGLLGWKGGCLLGWKGGCSPKPYWLPREGYTGVGTVQLGLMDQEHAWLLMPPAPGPVWQAPVGAGSQVKRGHTGTW